MAEQPQQAEAAAVSQSEDPREALMKRWEIEDEVKPTYLKGLDELIRRIATAGRDRVTLNQAVVDDFIGEVDSQISAQVNAILHHKDFQELESTWRGLKYLVDNSEFRQGVQIEVLSATKDDFLADFDEAGDWQKSGLFKRVYKDLYNNFGGEPYGAMVGAYDFDYRAPDVKLLTQISQVCAQAKCPFVAATSPKMFGKEHDSFEGLPKMKEMYEIFDRPEYAKWRSFRATDEARYIGLTMPRFLLRKPYTIEDQAVKEFTFEEDVRKEKHDHYLWGNAAFAFAGRMADSFAKYGWYSHMVGPTSGGAVEDLPLHQYESMGQVETKIPTEQLISEDMDVDLCNFGFIPLVMRRDSDNAAFFDAPSAKIIPEFPNTAEGKEDETRARLNSAFPYLLMTCRIAHFLKVIWRENMGRVMDAEKMQKEINKWLGQYRRQGTLDEELASRFPLKEISVTAEAIPGKPGQYKSQIQMVPHFRLKGVEIELTMVGQFDPPPNS